MYRYMYTVWQRRIQSWTLGGGDKCLFHVESFLILLFAIGDIAILGGHGPPAHLDPPLPYDGDDDVIGKLVTVVCNRFKIQSVSSLHSIQKQKRA